MRELFKGWLGEKMTTFGIWLKLDPKVYRRLHNVILAARGGTTQIDHVFLSIYGLFVIETKNMDGWIFGSGQQESWTQQLFRRTFKFQNPLRQNYRHTQSLCEFLGLDPRFLHSVVVSIGDVELKTPLPENVLTRGLSRYVESFTEPVLTPAKVLEFEHRLWALKAEPTLTRSNHVKTLRERHESVTTCPKCGGALTKRVAKRGPMAGDAFYGCINYPNRRHTKSA